MKRVGFRLGILVLFGTGKTEILENVTAHPNGPPTKTAKSEQETFKWLTWMNCGYCADNPHILIQNPPTRICSDGA